MLTRSPLPIDYRPIASLIPYARNARTHSEAQVALIAGSIREFGFTNPVLVDGENGIIAGHGRVLAARKLGLASVPVIELGHLSEAQKRAYILADNRLAEQAGWDQRAAGARGGRPRASSASTSARSASRRPRSMRCCARPRPTRARRRPRSRPRFRFPSRATSGSSGRIGCSAAAPPSRPTWRGCSAACGRT